MESEPKFVKRKLHSDDGRAKYWLSQSPQARLEAMEVIRQTNFGASYDPESAFPRILRITRKARR
jgi:hypothetical protein